MWSSDDLSESTKYTQVCATLVLEFVSFLTFLPFGFLYMWSSDDLSASTKYAQVCAILVLEFVSFLSVL